MEHLSIPQFLVIAYQHVMLPEVEVVVRVLRVARIFPHHRHCLLPGPRQLQELRLEIPEWSHQKLVTKVDGISLGDSGQCPGGKEMPHQRVIIKVEVTSLFSDAFLEDFK